MRKLTGGQEGNVCKTTFLPSLRAQWYTEGVEARCLCTREEGHVLTDSFNAVWTCWGWKAQWMWRGFVFVLILYTQCVLLLPTPKTDLFSTCLRFMRWPTLTWWIPLEPHSDTLFSKNMIQLTAVNSKLRWPKSQKQALLGFFLLSLTVCVIRPRKFMARQSYFSDKSSSFTSAILNTAFRQVSLLRELARQPVTFSAYFAIANCGRREGDALTETAKYLWVCSCNTCILASPKFSTSLLLTCHRMSAMVWEPFPKQAEHLRSAGFPRREGKRFANKSQFCGEDFI